MIKEPEQMFTTKETINAKKKKKIEKKTNNLTITYLPTKYGIMSLILKDRTVIFIEQKGCKKRIRWLLRSGFYILM